MRERRVGYALLTREEKLSGIFTEHDVLHGVMGKDDVLEQPVSRLMRPDPVSVMESDFVRKAAYHMHEKGYRYIPVVDRREPRDRLRQAQRHHPLPGGASGGSGAGPAPRSGSGGDHPGRGLRNDRRATGAGARLRSARR